MTSPEFFRANLRTAMCHKDVSQRALARKSRTSYPYVNRVLSGATAPTLPRCERLATAIGFPLADLIQSPKLFRRLLLTSQKKPVKA